MKTLRVTVMGCGHSAGTPMIGNEWLDCDEFEPRNRRTRASLCVQGEKGALIIDTGPDFRNQINTFKINQIDAVLYSHYHADHIAGIDDLRHWCRRRKIENFPVYMNEETFGIMGVRYDYLIKAAPDEFYPLLLKPHILAPADLYRPITLGGVPVTLFEQDHRTCTSLGVRVGNFAYSTDMLALPEPAFEVLQGIETWVVDGASYKGQAFVHANLEMVFEMNRRVGAPAVYLTHMPPNMDYQTLLRELPSGYAPAYDGLTFDIPI